MVTVPTVRSGKSISLDLCFIAPGGIETENCPSLDTYSRHPSAVSEVRFRVAVTLCDPSVVRTMITTTPIERTAAKPTTAAVIQTACDDFCARFFLKRDFGRVRGGSRS